MFFGGFIFCTPGLWTGDIPIIYTYQWLRNGANIDGATSSQRECNAEDDGQILSCLVTAINALGQAEAISNEISTNRCFVDNSNYEFIDGDNYEYVYELPVIATYIDTDERTYNDGIKLTYI